MPASAPTTSAKTANGDIAGGLAAAGVNFALAISLGLLAFMPLGPKYYEIGIYAGFASAIYGQFVAGIFGGAAHPGSGPRAATTLILAALIAALAADPALAPSATQGPEWIVAIAAATVVLAGVIQVVLGTLGAGSSARFVPYPFVAGFMCGASALIIVAQIAPIAGVSPAVLASGPTAVWNAMEPATLLVGLATALFIWVVGTKWKRWPAPLIGLVAGSLLYYAIAFVLPTVRLGAVVGAAPGLLPLPTALAPLAHAPWAAIEVHLRLIVTTAGLIAFIGTLDGLFAAVAIDNVTDGRHKTKREVVAHGFANVISGLCGGLPVVLSRAVAQASWNAGGRTRRTTVISVTVLAVGLAFGGPLIAKIPVAVSAGLMITLGIALIDNWTKGLAGRMRRKGALREQALLWSAATVTLVTLAEVLFGFMPAIAIGFQLSGFLLYLGMKRSLVRSVVDATVRPSRRVWGGEDAVRVTAVRRRIRVIELEGALFFGSAERLIERVEPLAGAADAVVLDFRRVTVIDATGAMLLGSITRRLAKKGTMVLLAGVTPQGRHGATLAAHDTYREPASRLWFRDADQAVEWAERAILDAAGHAEHEGVPLAGLSASRRPQGRRARAHHAPFRAARIRCERSAVPGGRSGRSPLPARERRRRDLDRRARWRARTHRDQRRRLALRRGRAPRRASAFGDRAGGRCDDRLRIHALCARRNRAQRARDRNQADDEPRATDGDPHARDQRDPARARRLARLTPLSYSTVTDFARLRGLSTSVPRIAAA